MGFKDMDLLVDIGNSSTVMAHYADGAIFDERVIASDAFLSAFKDLDLTRFSRVIVSCVVPEIDQELAKFDQVVFVTSDNVPLAGINMDTVTQVGADRLVNAVSAYHLIGSSCLIVDSGTAVTFCYVDGTGIYQGGAIFPGMGISSQALNLYAAKIPHILVSPRDSLLGKTTKQAVQNGLYFGFIELINGMISRYKKIDASLTVVGTGKGLEVIREHCNLDRYEPHLILNGLAICADSWD